MCGHGHKDDESQANINGVPRFHKVPGSGPGINYAHHKNWKKCSKYCTIHVHHSRDIVLLTVLKNILHGHMLYIT